MKRTTQRERFVAREIMKGVEGLDVDETLKSVIYAFFSSTMNFASPIPSLTLTEEDEVLIHWICGAVSLQVNADRSGVFYLWGRNADGKEYESDDHDSIIAVTSLVLREMESQLEKQNPNWQENYRKFACN